MDDEPSKWWPCPECGSVEFRPASCVFERGGWVDDETWRADDPPNGHPTAIAMDVTCLNCGHEFDIARYYEWPIIGEFRVDDLEPGRGRADRNAVDGEHVVD